MTAGPHESPGGRRDAARLVLRLALLVPALLLALAGCGLSTNEKPETIKDNVPPDLLETESATPEAPLGSTGEVVKVWFVTTDKVGDTQLVEAERQVPPPATQVIVLETLITHPPTEAERDRGISTDVPEDVSLGEQPQQRSDHVLIVNLSDEFYDLQGETARNAFAQIVFTATGLPGVEKVQFERDGEVFNAVNGEGQSTSEPLGRADFADLAPPQTDPI